MALSAPLTFDEAYGLVGAESFTVEYVCDQFGYDAADIAVFGILAASEKNAMRLAEAVGGTAAHPHNAHKTRNSDALPHWHISYTEPLSNIHIWYIK